MCSVHSSDSIPEKISNGGKRKESGTPSIAVSRASISSGITITYTHTNTLTQTCTSTWLQVCGIWIMISFVLYICVLLSLCLSVFPDRSRSEVDLSHLGDGFSNDPLPGRSRSVPGLNDAVCPHCNCTLTFTLPTKDSFPSHYCTVLVKEHYLAGWYLVTDIWLASVYKECHVIGWRSGQWVMANERLREYAADVCSCVIGVGWRHWCPDVCTLQNQPQCQQCSICGINFLPKHLHTYTHWARY